MKINKSKDIINESENDLDKQQKAYRELKFTDDFMFTKILENNMDICKRVVELILEIEIKEVCLPERQKTIEILPDSKGIRLDVYVTNDADVVYNIEMQTTVKKELPKRSRYYQGMIDLNLIERGAKYEELKRSFVIFICLEDPFKMNYPIYRFENVCLQDKNVLLNDEAIKVFINADGDLSGVSVELAAFLKYLKSGIVQDEFAQKIEREVEKARKHVEWEVEYMTLYLRDQENYNRGREEGREEGRVLALASLVKEGMISVYSAAQRVNMTVEEFEKKLEQINK